AVSDFMYFDNISQGNWKDKYGSLGRTITLQSTNLPPNLSITFSNIFHANYGWSDDNRLLQPEGNTQRLTAWWANGMPWGIDVDSRDDVTRSIAFYFVDWDRKNRSFDFEAYDVTTQKLLFKQVVGDHQNGVYIVCSIKGRVFYKITPRTLYQGQLLLGMFLDSAPTAAPPVITPNGGAFAGKVQVGMSAPSGTQIRYTIDGSEPSEASAQYSAPFTLAASATVKARGFRAGYAPSQTVSASFQNSLVTTFGAMGSDTSTKGGWRGVYGGEGYLLPIAGSVTPAYSELNFPTVSTWVWQDTTSDTRGQIKPASADRMAACWYAKDLLQFDVAVLDTQLHCLALYFVDWDNRGRRQIVEVLDMNGKVMDKTELSDFSGGVYLRYKLKGQVRIRITRVAGDNAVLNGMFFDEGPVEVTPVAPVQSVAKSSDGRALFTFAAQTGSTICVDVSSDLKTWVHTGNNVVVDGKIQLKVDESNWHPGRFYRCHTAH
ncbi:MAG: chitobiase/beta-hexosaminidase C-terminal domain-containing protein, partial [Verrucomicrobiales bacterium]